MIHHYIVSDSLNTEFLLVKTNNSVFWTNFICREWHFINFSKISWKCSFVTSLSTDSCTEYKTSSLPYFYCGESFQISLFYDMGNFFWIGNFYKVRNTVITFFFHFYITIMNEICWSLKSCEPDGCRKMILMKMMISKC